MKTYEELMYELEERKAMSILQRRKGKKFGGSTLEVEKDKGTGKRNNINKRKKRRKNRNNNKWPQSSKRSRRK